MHERNRSSHIKSVAAIITFCFTTTAIAWSQPGGASFEILSNSLAPKSSGEILFPSLIENIEIPNTLGTIEKRFQNSGPSIILIQDAHTSLDAQQNTEKILEHLSNEFGLDTLFLEGGIGKLDATSIRFFKDPKLNRKAAEYLLKRGVLGGAELFLLGSFKTSAFGVENPNLYKENLELFRAVIGKTAESSAMLEALKMRVFSLSSRALNQKLYRFFKEWLFYEDVDLATLLSHIGVLVLAAREELRINLHNPKSQIEWPQLARVIRLEQFAKEIKPEDVASDKEKLIRWSKEQKIDQAFINCFDKFSSACFKSENSNKSVRSFFERFFDAASPKGFSFAPYPALAKQIGSLILEDELDGEKLLSEAKQLQNQLLSTLAKTSEERALISTYHDYLELRKLFVLQLTHEDFNAIRLRASELSPTQLIHQIELVEKHFGNTTSRTKFSQDSSEIEALFQKALLFYEKAKLREQAMLEQMASRLKEIGKSNAVLVAGGFHTEGLLSLFEANHISYAVIRPRISQLENKSSYENAMMLRSNAQIETSHLRAATPALAGGLSELEAWLGKGTADYVRAEFKDAIKYAQETTGGASPVSIANPVTHSEVRTGSFLPRFQFKNILKTGVQSLLAMLISPFGASVFFISTSSLAQSPPAGATDAGQIAAAGQPENNQVKLPFEMSLGEGGRLSVERDAKGNVVAKVSTKSKTEKWKLSETPEKLEGPIGQDGIWTKVIGKLPGGGTIAFTLRTVRIGPVVSELATIESAVLTPSDTFPDGVTQNSLVVIDNDGKLRDSGNRTFTIPTTDSNGKTSQKTVQRGFENGDDSYLTVEDEKFTVRLAPQDPKKPNQGRFLAILQKIPGEFSKVIFRGYAEVLKTKQEASELVTKIKVKVLKEEADLFPNETLIEIERFPAVGLRIKISPARNELRNKFLAEKNSLSALVKEGHKPGALTKDPILEWLRKQIEERLYDNLSPVEQTRIKNEIAGGKPLENRPVLGPSTVYFKTPDGGIVAYSRVVKRQPEKTYYYVTAKPNRDAKVINPQIPNAESKELEVLLTEVMPFIERKLKNHLDRGDQSVIEINQRIGDAPWYPYAARSMVMSDNPSRTPYHLFEMLRALSWELGRNEKTLTPDTALLAVPFWLEELGLSEELVSRIKAQGKDQIIFKDQETGFVLLLGVDYNGEMKMGRLSMAMDAAYKDGGIGVQAGLSVQQIKRFDSERGGWKYENVVTVVGAPSLHGKSTTAIHLEFENSPLAKLIGINTDPKEKVRPMTDDIVLIVPHPTQSKRGNYQNPYGIIGAERGFYTNPDEPHPAINQGVHENVAIVFEPNGSYHLDYSANITKNQRAILDTDILKKQKGSTELLDTITGGEIQTGSYVPMEHMDRIMAEAIMRRNMAPPLIRVTLEQYVRAWMHGEGVRTGAATGQIGAPFNEFMFDPFKIGLEDTGPSRLYEVLKQMKENGIPMEFYVYNTGSILMKDGSEKKITKEITVMLKEAVLRGLVKFEYDSVLGVDVAVSIVNSKGEEVFNLKSEGYLPSTNLGEVMYQPKVQELKRKRYYGTLENPTEGILRYAETNKDIFDVTDIPPPTDDRERALWTAFFGDSRTELRRLDGSSGNSLTNSTVSLETLLTLLGGVSLNSAAQIAIASGQIASSAIQQENQKVFELLVEEVVSRAQELVPSNQTTWSNEKFSALKAAIRGHAISLEELTNKGLLNFGNGAGVALQTTSGDVNKRITFELLKMPFRVKLNPFRQNGNIKPIVLIGENAAQIRSSIFSKTSEFDAVTRNSLSRLIGFIPGDVEDAIRKANGGNLTAGIAALLSKDEAAGFSNLSRAIEFEGEIDLSGLSVEEAAVKLESHAVRERHMIAIASLVNGVQSPSERAALIRRYLASQFPHEQFNVSNDGEFNLTLDQVTARLADLRASLYELSKAA